MSDHEHHHGSGPQSKHVPSCHAPEPQPESEHSCCHPKKRIDYLLWGSLSGVVLGYGFHLLSAPGPQWLQHLAHGVFELMNTMAWGLALGIVMVALLSKVPREFVISILGTNRGAGGIFRATFAGLLLDLCSHGILMVGAKLYERGATAGQIMAFLIASPWNSLSLTLVLIALIGLKWTLLFILLSGVVAVITGLIFDALVSRKVLPANPNAQDLPEDFRFWAEARRQWRELNITPTWLRSLAIDGIKESRMVIRWLLFGVMLAAMIRAFVPPDYFSTYFGASLLGLAMTILVATVLEVCSEGSTPIAADIFNRADAPGNAFAFLMTGVSTDYTEIMILKDTTRSWKIALFLPLITLPQIVTIVLIINAL